MQYAVLIYLDPNAAEMRSEAEQAADTQEYLAIRKDPRVVDGVHLKPVTTATTVRVQNAETLVTDGPFADTKEVFAGYYIVEADDLDQVLELVGRIPGARHGSVEVRPVEARH